MLLFNVTKMITRISLLVLLYNLVFNCEARLSKTSIKGVLVPVPTPYYNNHTAKINYDQIGPMAEYYASAGVNGVVVASRSGEGYLLSGGEVKALIKAWVEASRRCGLAVLAVVGDPTPSNVELAQYAESVGVDAILVLLPLFYKPMNADAAVADMKLFTDNVKNTPVLLYNDLMTIPECVRIEEVHRRATNQLPNYAGMLCNLETALKIRAAGLYKPSQLLLITGHHAIGLTFYAGFNATVAVSNSIAPGLAVAIKNSHNQDEVCDYQEKINKIVRAVAKSPYDYISYIKAAVSIISGIEVGGLRLPLETPTFRDKQRITENLQKLGVDLRCPAESCDDCDSTDKRDKH